MINFDVTKENIKEHNPNWPKTSDHPYKILMIGGSWFGKTKSLFNLINHQRDIDNIFLYAKYLNEAKYGFLIKKRKNVRTKHFNDSKAYIEYSDDMDDIYKNIEEYNLNNKRRILIFLDSTKFLNCLKKITLFFKQIVSIILWYFSG